MLRAVTVAPKKAPKKAKRSRSNLLHFEHPAYPERRATWPKQMDLLGGAAQATYEETRNPLLPWLAWIAARAAKRPLPLWAVEAFDRWAGNLSHALAAYDRPGGAAESQRLVAEALELTGGVGTAGPFSELRARRFDEIAAGLFELAERDGKTREDALAFAADFFGCDARTIERALKRLNDRML